MSAHLHEQADGISQALTAGILCLLLLLLLLPPAHTARHLLLLLLAAAAATALSRQLSLTTAPPKTTPLGPRHELLRTTSHTLQGDRQQAESRARL